MNGVFIGSVHLEKNDDTSKIYDNKAKHDEDQEFDCGSNEPTTSNIEQATQELKQLLLGQSEAKKTSNSCGTFIGMAIEKGAKVRSYAAVTAGVREQLNNTTTVRSKVKTRTSDGFTKILADTGAQGHVFKDEGPMCNVQSKNLPSIVGCSGDMSSAKKMGDATMKARDGTIFSVNKVKIMPGIQRNILSVTQMMSEGWTMKGEKEQIILTLGDKRLKFRLLEKNLYYAEAIFLKPRHTVTTNTTTLLEDDDGDLDDPSYTGMPGLVSRDPDSSDDDSDDSMPFLLSRSNIGWDSSDDDSSDDDCDDDEYDLPKSNFNDIEMIGNLTSKVKRPKPALKAETKTGTSKPARLIKIDRNVAHDQWGHNNRKRDKFFAKLLGYELTGDEVECDACGIAKAKRANVSKTTSVRTSRPGERIYVDTSGPFEGAPAHKKYVHGLVDDYSDKCMMQFSPAKKHMTQFVEQAFIAFKGQGKPIKYV